LNGPGVQRAGGDRGVRAGFRAPDPLPGGSPAGGGRRGVLGRSVARKGRAELGGHSGAGGDVRGRVAVAVAESEWLCGVTKVQGSECRVLLKRAPCTLNSAPSSFRAPPSSPDQNHPTVAAARVLGWRSGRTVVDLDPVDLGGV